ncbi:hypothetical protein RHSIM_Rhsim11G0143700 [Rhododendron simsii]|uniref:Uncharacterized protein n=1 Tax=Rhododendron simsii TaxID=118357 RepID=A0A834G8W8_RHOSS|nr:hypothetical protein RHSIM_Rhsim11G0143700 [Rhododendron simsii]
MMMLTMATLFKIEAVCRLCDCDMRDFAFAGISRSTATVFIFAGASRSNLLEAVANLFPGSFVLAGLGRGGLARGLIGETQSRLLGKGK